jgi:hypothetical protein
MQVIPDYTSRLPRTRISRFLSRSWHSSTRLLENLLRKLSSVSYSVRNNLLIVLGPTPTVWYKLCLLDCVCSKAFLKFYFPSRFNKTCDKNISTLDSVLIEDLEHYNALMSSTSYKSYVSQTIVFADSTRTSQYLRLSAPKLVALDFSTIKEESNFYHFSGVSAYLAFNSAINMFSPSKSNSGIDVEPRFAIAFTQNCTAANANLYIKNVTTSEGIVLTTFLKNCFVKSTTNTSGIQMTNASHLILFKNNNTAKQTNLSLMIKYI